MTTAIAVLASPFTALLSAYWAQRIWGWYLADYAAPPPVSVLFGAMLIAFLFLQKPNVDHEFQIDPLAHHIAVLGAEAFALLVAWGMRWPLGLA